MFFLFVLGLYFWAEIFFISILLELLGLLFFFVVAFGGVIFLVFWSLRTLCQLATLMFLVCISQVKIIQLGISILYFCHGKRTMGPHR